MSKLTSMVLFAFLWGFAGAAGATDPLLDAATGLVVEPARLVSEWEFNRYACIAIVSIVILLGGVVAMLSKLPNGSSAAGTVALGTAVTVLTALGNTLFDFDHRQYRAMATQGRQLLIEINYRKNQLSAFPIDQSQVREAILEDIRRHANAILALPSTFKAPPARVTRMEAMDLLVGTAHAQSARPEWLTKPPQDDENLYFLGDAEGSDYFATVSGSRKNAMEQARGYLTQRLATQQSGAVDSAAAAKYLLDSAKVVSSYTSYHSKERTVRVYTLVSVSKRIADSDLRLYGTKTSQKVLPVQQQSLKEAVRSQSEYLNLKR